MLAGQELYYLGHSDSQQFFSMCTLFIFPLTNKATNNYLLDFIILLTFRFRLLNNYWLALKAD
jgi:hypothetical protein